MSNMCVMLQALDKARYASLPSHVPSASRGRSGWAREETGPCGSRLSEGPTERGASRDKLQPR